MGRFDCIYTLKKVHASKTKTLNLSVKIEKNNHIISSNIDDLLVPDLSCYNCGDCSISKIQRCKKVEFIGSHKRVTMEENVCESNDERIYSDSDAIENIVRNLTICPEQIFSDSWSDSFDSGSTTVRGLYYDRVQSKSSLFKLIPRKTTSYYSSAICFFYAE